MSKCLNVSRYTVQYRIYYLLCFVSLYVAKRRFICSFNAIKTAYHTLPLTLRHYLVNGMVVSTLELEAGKRMRFRISFAGQAEDHTISLQNSSDCEMGVLAKDGVYLGQVPRMMNKLFFTLASRWDEDSAYPRPSLLKGETFPRIRSSLKQSLLKFRLVKKYQYQRTASTLLSLLVFDFGRLLYIRVLFLLSPPTLYCTVLTVLYCIVLYCAVLSLVAVLFHQVFKYFAIFPHLCAFFVRCRLTIAKPPRDFPGSVTRLARLDYEAISFSRTWYSL